MSAADAWNRIEAEKAKTGEYPQASEADHHVYLSWMRECDARKSHALLFQQKKDQPVNDLLKIRALLFRGQLDEAESIINRLADSGTSSEARMEALLEKARLAAFQGDWEATQVLSASALDSGSLESLSYLSTLQVHALASFELGELLKALKSLEVAESLSAVFPFSISTLYASVLKARITARDQSVQSGLDLLRNIWSELRLSGRKPTPDYIHAIVFGTVDILKFARSVGKDADALEKMTLISFHMTEAMGEKLYSGLAAIDAAVCGPQEHRGWFFDRLNQSRQEFARISSLSQEVFGNSEPTSASAAVLRELREAIRSAASDSGDSSGCAQPVSRQPLSLNYVVFSEQQWAFRLQPWLAVDLNPHPQILSAFKALRRGAVSKADFFARVWGNARYASRLHDSSIWYVLNRIKKLTGASYRTRNGVIEPNEGVMTL
jgi:hypothetical protein